jgi:hypothetical protein
MSDLRQWTLKPNQPLSLQIAADARLSPTDYVDDQSWELVLGAVDQPALSLQTRYGGRAGLASIVPMWTLDRRTIYEFQAYARAPMITGFAPGYLRAEASLTPDVHVQLEYWVMESHAVGGRFTLANGGTTPVSVQLDLVGFVASNGKEHALRVETLPDGAAALLMSKVGNLHPVVLLEGGRGVPESGSRIGRAVDLLPGGEMTVRWIHTGRTDVNDSLALARRWMSDDWTPHLARMLDAAAAIPVIHTGDDQADAAIAFSFQQLVQSFLHPTNSLPHASFVALRQPGRGFSPRGDGTDHLRAWAGQEPTLAYLNALGIASINPQMAQGIVLNYLAVQQEDGWIDWRPGLAGQRQGMMLPPLLARLTWGVFQYTEDVTFLQAALPGLLRAFDRWFQPDLDHDTDALPEWQSEVQTGYPFVPTFAISAPWGQHANINRIEAPDLASYLLSEAVSLREIAYFLRDEAIEARITPYIDRLKASLEKLWQPKEKRYAYVDRDTHLTSPAEQVLENARADEEQFIACKLASPNRLIVRITGGQDRAPQMLLTIDGLDQNGSPITETADTEQFIWTHSRGVYTTQQVFSQVDRAKIDGLATVYNLHIQTVDSTGIDISTLLPIWSVGISKERADEVVRLMIDTAHFWRQTGVPMCSARDSHYDAAGVNGSGGVRPFWITLLGEGLIEYNLMETAAELIRRLLRAQVNTLKAQNSFSEYYNADDAVGAGDKGHMAGVVPVHLLLRVLGVRVVNPRKVWTGGLFAWEHPISLTQHGVTVSRSKTGTTVQFPSGGKVELPADAPWQEIADQTT